MTGTGGETLDLHVPDHMGVWADSGEIIWLPREHYPKRIEAIVWAVREWGCDFREVRCRARSMHYAPDVALDENGIEVWRDDLWAECEKTSPDAFPVWRLEAS